MPQDNITDAELIMLLALAADKRTCLIIGESVKNSKRTEGARRRATFLEIREVAMSVLIETLRLSASNPELRSPDEVVVRVLRPQAE